MSLPAYLLLTHTALEIDNHTIPIIAESGATLSRLDPGQSITGVGCCAGRLLQDNGVCQVVSSRAREERHVATEQVCSTLLPQAESGHTWLALLPVLPSRVGSSNA